MRWKKYGVEMDMTGITRKAVAEILAEQFDTKVVFCLSDNGYNVPDQNQRLWRILPSDSIKAEKAEKAEDQTAKGMDCSCKS